MRSVRGGTERASVIRRRTKIVVGSTSTPADSGLGLGLDNITPGGGGGDEDDCSVHTIGASGTGGLWLLGAVGALMMRRRRRSRG